MATRSLIGMFDADGGVDYIYCHWDGYPAGVGRTLLEHYGDPSKIRELIQLGDLSELGAVIGVRRPFDGPPDGQCVAYGRDRGGVNARATHARDGADLVRLAAECGAEFVYVWAGGAWKFAHLRNLSDFALLTKEACQ